MPDMSVLKEERFRFLPFEVRISPSIPSISAAYHQRGGGCLVMVSSLR